MPWLTETREFTPEQWAEVAKRWPPAPDKLPQDCMHSGAVAFGRCSTCGKTLYEVTEL